MYDLSLEQETESAQHHQERFKVFREMYRVREFQLVLCADVPYCVTNRAMWALEDIVEAERKNGGLDYLACEPLIISERRVPHTRLTDSCTDSAL